MKAMFLPRVETCINSKSDETAVTSSLYPFPAILMDISSGNDYLVQLSQFTALYELGQQNGDSVDLNVLTQYRNRRFQESVNNNPYFFNAPFSGVIAQPAAWSFIYTFMANKSEE
jgi:hypothetical protein